MKITTMRLDEMHEIKKNIRRHTEKQLKEYVRSIEMFGQIKPILVDETGEILAGNGLFQALKRAGKETADCYVIKGLDENRKKKLMLADNRVYELGMTDTNAFEEIIKELDGDIDVPGWDEDLLETLNLSMQDTIKEVESYGTYSDQQIKTIESHDVVQHETQATAPAAYQPVSMTHKYDEAVNTAAVQPTPMQPIAPAPQAIQPEADGTPAEQHRYIICPKCGEKICL